MVIKENHLRLLLDLNQSELEIERKLEQMRAIENGMKIVLGLIDELPISVDTKEDLEIARRSMVIMTKKLDIERGGCKLTYCLQFV